MAIRSTKKDNISEEGPLTVEILNHLIANERHMLNNDLKELKEEMVNRIEYVERKLEDRFVGLEQKILGPDCHYVPAIQREVAGLHDHVEEIQGKTQCLEKLLKLVINVILSS